MTLLAPQMMINLRRKYYRYIPVVGTRTAILPAGVSFQSQELSWNAELPQEPGQTTIDTSIMNY